MYISRAALYFHLNLITPILVKEWYIKEWNRKIENYTNAQIRVAIEPTSLTTKRPRLSG